MIPEIGNFALVLALAIALIQSVVPMLGAARGRLDWMLLARPVHPITKSACTGPRRWDIAIASWPRARTNNP